MLAGALDMLLPPACPICGKPKGADALGENICKSCLGRVNYIKEPTCLICGKAIEKETAELCRDCESHKHYFDQAVAVYEYSDGIKASIYRFKYYNKREYAKSYGKEMSVICGEMLRFWAPDVIIPIPIHESKLKTRKFNQAELIAKSLSQEIGVLMDENCLIRVRKTLPMKELNNESRRKNLQNAFQVDRKVVKYSKVLLVDDIYTTGATFDECARVLKDAGVDKVYGISLCIGDGF